MFHCLQRTPGSMLSAAQGHLWLSTRLASTGPMATDTFSLQGSGTESAFRACIGWESGRRLHCLGSWVGRRGLRRTYGTSAIFPR